MLQWGHVSEDVETPTRAARPSWLPARFNGATSLRTWKLTAHEAYADAAALLQWGHVSEDVETATAAHSLTPPAPASMGPRL